MTDDWPARRAENRASWDARVPWHLASPFYDLPGFLRGESPLRGVERELLGDVRGKRLLHLQCHFGQDTLALARLGARVTGLDFSPVALEAARRLAAQLGLEARFVEADVYDAPAAVGERFDVVYTSYGVLGWLPDLRPWARAVAGCLAPGGRLVLVEFHPFVWMLDDALEHLVHPNDGGPIVEDVHGTYADRDAPIRGRTHGWNHGLGTLVGSLLEAGLTLTHLREHDWSPYDVLGEMVEVEPGRFRTARHGDRLPLVVALTAAAPGGPGAQVAGAGEGGR